MIHRESVRERDSVSPADDHTVGGPGASPDPTLDAGIDILRGIVGPERRKEVRRGGNAQPVTEESPARTDVDGPSVREGEVKTGLVKRERCPYARRAEAARPCAPKHERVHRHHAARRIWAIDRLRDVAQTDAAVD